jgi:hypothetical protein
MFDSTRKDVPKIVFGVDLVELSSSDERVARGRSLTATVGAGEEVVLATFSRRKNPTFILLYSLITSSVKGQIGWSADRVRISAGVDDGTLTKGTSLHPARAWEWSDQNGFNGNLAQFKEMLQVIDWRNLG